MDAALKLARQYFMELSPPQPQRTRFIARQESYHGNTLGALCISGHKARRSIYEPMLSSNTSHVSACNAYRGQREGETIEAYVQRLAMELDREFQRINPETVCAFVAEPVVGAVSKSIQIWNNTPESSLKYPIGPRMRSLCTRLLQSHESRLQ